jgi:hypothetical protein
VPGTTWLASHASRGTLLDDHLHAVNALLILQASLPEQSRLKGDAVVLSQLYSHLPVLTEYLVSQMNDLAEIQRSVSGHSLNHQEMRYPALIDEARHAQARDAAAKHAHHASAVQVAIRQGDREAATRQARERERWAAFAEHAETEAQRYNEMAGLQSQHMQDLRDMETELRTACNSMERQAMSAFIELRYQQALGVHRRWLHDLEAAREGINSVRVEAAALKASHNTDPMFESTLLRLRDRSQAVDDEIDREMRGDTEWTT